LGINSNFDKFMTSLTKDFEKWDNNKKRLVKKVPLACLQHLQKESPVLTGRYRAAHTLSIDNSDDWTPDDLGPNEKKAIMDRNKKLSPESRTAHSSYSNKAAERFDSASRKLTGLEIKKKMTIYLQNNLEYALHVEARDSIYGIVEERFDRYVRENLR
jgi:hypothetical protein